MHTIPAYCIHAYLRRGETARPASDDEQIKLMRLQPILQGIGRRESFQLHETADRVAFDEDERQAVPTSHRENARAT